MLVKCVSNKRSSLNEWHPNFSPHDIAFDLIEIGQRFLVSGILLFNHGPEYLLQGDDYPDIPRFAPAQLFAIAQPVSSFKWFGGHITTRFGETPAVGYLEWVSKPKHFDGLVENRSEDIEIFIRRAAEQRLAIAS